MLQKKQSWICCQIGARRHYADARALHQAGKLAHLITDGWVRPESFLPSLPLDSITRLRQRFHPDLSQASVHAFTASLIRFEISQSLQRTEKWEKTIARNYWFQKHAVKLLNNLHLQESTFEEPVTIFSHSYAALEIFRYAKSKGWRTILSQINPGLIEEQIVKEEHKRHPEYSSTWQPAPYKFWVNWREECSLADQIIVSSLWSSQALQQIGIPEKKINIIPLAYQPPKQAQNFTRRYPAAFSSQRPLRVLFLGQVNIRKGIVALLEASKLLHDQPVEFWLVGPKTITIPQESEIQEKVQWFGSVPRGETAKYYQSADVFLFPTLSDGFGITQIEAQAWKLPIIASKFCGDVVKDKVNGMILPEVTGEAIAKTILFCLQNPQQLEAFVQEATNTSRFNLSQLQHNLQLIS